MTNKFKEFHFEQSLKKIKPQKYTHRCKGFSNKIKMRMTGIEPAHRSTRS